MMKQNTEIRSQNTEKKLDVGINANSKHVPLEGNRRGWKCRIHNSSLLILKQLTHVLNACFIRFMMTCVSHALQTRASKRRYHSSFLIFNFTLLIILSSCTRYLPEQELINYIKNPDNGVLQEKNIKNVNYKVYYRPSDLLVNQELQAYSEINDSLIEHYQDIYHKNLYFIVSISQNNQEVLSNLGGNQQAFGAMVNQLAFGMGTKVSLTTNQKDTLQLLDFIYPRTYGVGSSTDLLFAFENKHINQAEWLSLKIEDFGLQTGDVRFKFQAKDIRKIPNLKFE